MRTSALGRVREELVHLHKVGVDGPEMTTKVSDVELAELEVPDCHSFGWLKRPRSDPTCRPTQAFTPSRRQDRRCNLCRCVVEEVSRGPEVEVRDPRSLTNQALGQIKMWTSPKTSSVLAIEDVEFCQTSFLLTFLNNWMMSFELLKKSLKKSTRQT